MDIKAIVFDKDGTFVEYEPFWCSIASEAVKAVLVRIEVDTIYADEILSEYADVVEKPDDIIKYL